MDERPVKSEAEFTDLAGSFCCAGLGRGVAAGRQGRYGPFHQAELTVCRSLERTKVPRFEAVPFKLHAGPCHLEGVFIEAAANVADEPKAQQGFQQRHARSRLGAQLLLGQRPSPSLPLSSHSGRDSLGRHSHAGWQILRALSAIDGVQVILDDFQRKVLITLKCKDEPEALDVTVRVLPVACSGPLGIDESLFLQETNLGRSHSREVVTQLGEDFPNVQDLRSAAVRLGDSHRQVPRQTCPAARTGLR